MKFTCRFPTPSLLMTFLTLSTLAACSGGSENADNHPSTTAGDYNLTLSMSEYMAHVLEPTADELWGSAGWINDKFEGYYELYPTDDEGWQRVENFSAMIVEAGNTLLLPGRVQEGPWSTYAQALSDVGLRAMQASETQNEEDFFQAGAQIYSVCTACHQAYNPDIVSRF
ncbi:hypothetical protein GCM10011403_06920 [Pseudohongiella nitratireducens]|uniref:Cytochrome c n=1 Tax=Pseudohongiella nitratireducens TaxID=1768907 RepID=A0A917GN38_9GAMM|nr:hypothetical protein [Pseudohongiella nitratireducens]MDF1623575.1 hypothetical protein [Pseudohongiella nitratireducens]GGG52330.1 hypothetical protein GCM10011403_06920 [Pseudohongiella nitratireducens]